MKKQLYSLLAVAMLAGLSAQAQDDKKAPKVKTEKQEITINADTEDDGNGKKRIVINKSRNGQAEKMVIVVDGENVTINGKPAKDFKGTMDFFNKEDFDFDTDINLHMAPHMFGNEEGINHSFSKMHSNKAMLGVVTEKNEKGAKVTDITEESAAAKAGIKEGDVIVSINADKVTDDNDLVKLIGKYKPEDNVDVTVLRDGKEKKLQARLGKNESIDMAFNFNGGDNGNFNFSMPAMPGTPRAPRAFNFNNDEWNMGEVFAEKPKYGFSIADNEDGDGVKITAVKEATNAAKAGLKEGDLITETNGVAVKNTDELKKQLSQSKDKSDITMKVMRNGSSQSITVKVPKKIKTADL